MHNPLWADMFVNNIIDIILITTTVISIANFVQFFNQAFKRIKDLSNQIIDLRVKIAFLEKKIEDTEKREKNIPFNEE